jgi:hypothetical protein
MAFLRCVAGALLLVGGAGTWYAVSTSLSAEQITVSGGAPCQLGEAAHHGDDRADHGQRRRPCPAGRAVNGPLEAYCMAEIINEPALKATEGNAYAQRDREDPLRQIATNGSSGRPSLLTSVVSFGVAASAMGVGLSSIIAGVAISARDRRTRVDEVAMLEAAAR